ncbi:MAG: hypothetical protein ACFFCV_13335 [Promethearchaeota archaeon]
MKKSNILLTSIIIFSITFAIAPPVVPQVGTYTFLGAAGNEKILRVRTVNNASLEDLFGAGWKAILEGSFGEGCINVGAGLKSIVVSVNTSATYDLTAIGMNIENVTTYVTNTWNWTVGAFSNTPHNYNVSVMSFYDPTVLSEFIHIWWSFAFLDVNVSVQNAAAFLTQLPIPVAQYLGAITWEDQWENVGNTVVHNALAGNVSFSGFTYLEDCTEIWTYDETYGAYLGYKIVDNETNVIYEYNWEAPSGAAISGYDLPIVMGIASIGVVSLIFIAMKKKR